MHKHVYNIIIGYKLVPNNGEKSSPPKSHYKQRYVYAPKRKASDRRDVTIVDICIVYIGVYPE